MGVSEGQSRVALENFQKVGFKRHPTPVESDILLVYCPFNREMEAQPEVFDFEEERWLTKSSGVLCNDEWLNVLVIKVDQADSFGACKEHKRGILDLLYG